MPDECVNILKVSGNPAILRRFLESIRDENTFRISQTQTRLDTLSPKAELLIDCGEPALVQRGEETQAGFWFATPLTAPDDSYRKLVQTWPELRFRAWAEAPCRDYYYHGENIGSEWISEGLSFQAAILSLCNRKRAWLKVLNDEEIKRVDWIALLTDPEIIYRNYSLPGDPVELDIVLPRGQLCADLIRKHTK